jgi:hypothetical protein
MDIIMIAFLALLIVVLLVKKRIFNDNKRLQKRNRCEVHHTWIYKDNNNGGDYMVCKDCGALPGTDELYEP